jgi:hypothetical protein
MYDGSNEAVSCSIDENDEGKVCEVTNHGYCHSGAVLMYPCLLCAQLTFTFDEDANGPLYVYYELENFYQNHRRYVSSRDAFQLEGTV